MIPESKWPKTNQPSSAETQGDMPIAIGQDKQPSSFITPSSKTGTLGDRPIDVVDGGEGYGKEDVATRMTTNYGSKDSGETGQDAGLDGSKIIAPMGEEPRSYVVTNFVK